MAKRGRPRKYPLPEENAPNYETALTSEPAETEETAPPMTSGPRRRGGMDELRFSDDKDTSEAQKAFNRKYDALAKKQDGDEPDEPADTETEEVETAPEPNESKTTEEIVFEEWAIQRAGQFGITPERAKAFRSQDELIRTIGMAEQMAEAYSQKQATQQESGQNGNRDTRPQRDPDEPTFALPQKTSNTVSEPGDDAFGEETQDLSPELLKKVQAVHEYGQKQRTALQQQVQELQRGYAAVVRALQQSEQVNMISQFDRLVDGLGDDYQEMLGKGHTLDMEEGSEHQRARARLYEAIHTLARGYGERRPPFATLFRKAVAMEYGDKQAELARKNISRQLQSQKGRTVARPTQRSGMPKSSPRQTARDRFNQRAAEKGLEA